MIVILYVHALFMSNCFKIVSVVDVVCAVFDKTNIGTIFFVASSISLSDFAIQMNLTFVQGVVLTFHGVSDK